MACCGNGRSGVAVLCVAGMAGALALGYWIGSTPPPDGGSGVSAAAYTQPEQEVDLAEMWQKVLEYAEPGKRHARLAEMVGEWEAVSTFWMEPGEPTISHGRCVYEMVLGGRFLRSSYSMDFMGSPFEGIGFLGYDNFKGEYVSVWFDTMSTGAWVQAGHGDEAGTTVTIEGLAESAVGSELMRNVWKFESRDRHILEFYKADPDNPDEWQMTGVIAYTRAR